MPKPKSKKPQRSTNPIENRMVRSLDELSTIEELFSGMLPQLKKDLSKQMSATDIAKKYAALAQARIVATALTDPDSAKALAASKDILDRTLGKAKETKEIRHGMADASEAELDALLASKLKDVTPSSEVADD